MKKVFEVKNLLKLEIVLIVFLFLTSSTLFSQRGSAGQGSSIINAKMNQKQIDKMSTMIDKLQNIMKKVDNVCKQSEKMKMDMPTSKMGNHSNDSTIQCCNDMSKTIKNMCMEMEKLIIDESVVCNSEIQNLLDKLLDDMKSTINHYDKVLYKINSLRIIK